MIENGLDFNWWIIVITLIFIIFDFLTGFMQAVANKEVSSEKLRKGLFHKCGFMLAVCLGLLCEWAMQFVNLGFDVPIATAVCVYIILTEIMSILENLGKMSPELANSTFMQIFKIHQKEEPDNPVIPSIVEEIKEKAEE